MSSISHQPVEICDKTEVSQACLKNVFLTTGGGELDQIRAVLVPRASEIPQAAADPRFSRTVSFIF